MHSLVIGQIKTDEKSNEITTIPELLNILDIKAGQDREKRDISHSFYPGFNSHR